MLRVEEFGFAWVESEKLRIEQISAGEDTLGRDEPRIARECPVDAGCLEFLLGEERDRLHPVAEVRPQLIEVRGARKAAGHADDRDAMNGEVRIEAVRH